jgi:hypothetical protein
MRAAFVGGLFHFRPKANVCLWQIVLQKSFVDCGGGPVAQLVGIEGGVISGVFNLESSDVGAPDRRSRHEEHYHEA